MSCRPRQNTSLYYLRVCESLLLQCGVGWFLGCACSSVLVRLPQLPALRCAALRLLRGERGSSALGAPQATTQPQKPSLLGTRRWRPVGRLSVSWWEGVGSSPSVRSGPAPALGGLRRGAGTGQRRPSPGCGQQVQCECELMAAAAPPMPAPQPAVTVSWGQRVGLGLQDRQTRAGRAFLQWAEPGKAGGRRQS